MQQRNVLFLQVRHIFRENLCPRYLGCNMFTKKEQTICGEESISGNITIRQDNVDIIGFIWTRATLSSRHLQI
jgi:hypothetical protein